MDLFATKKTLRISASQKELSLILTLNVGMDVLPNQIYANLEFFSAAPVCARVR